MEFVLFLLAALACHGQTGNAVKISASDLRADAAILRSAYETLHPGLYRYSTKAEMDGKFVALDHRLDHNQTLQDAFLAFSEFAASVKCGHTQANPFNQSKAVVEALFKSPTRLPFYFEWIDRRMIVTRDFTVGRVLPRGTEVTWINGVAASAVLARLLSVARADGANDSKRVAQLGVNGDSEYETFDLYFPMFFPSAGGSVALVTKKPNARREERVSVKTLTFEERIAPIKEREAQRKGGDQALFEWRYLPDGSAYLRMPTWALYNSKWDWKTWLHGHLDELAERGSPGLVLDLRGNEGGDDVGNEIIPYLIDAPVTLSSMRRLVRYRKVPDDLVPYLDTWDKSFRDWGGSAMDMSEPWPTAPVGVSYLRLKRYDDGESGDVIKPAGKRFKGKVFV
ncbi:S41 family peptidase [Granulicella sibirica]|uniref:Peptidase, S41 family n=1 Tax=Granulicella sibirica TaxID=2479048 RepID=A0A4Q0T0K7_9BACT|nr:S41 family peptidase [Granulicella sibirica]RXH55349.1 Peptidase, S41 family [Granulicella sibirica]